MTDIFVGNFVTGEIAYALSKENGATVNVEDEVDDLLTSMGYNDCIFAIYPSDFAKNLYDFRNRLSARMG